MSDYVKIDVEIAKEGCWEKCEDFDIQMDNLYGADIFRNCNGGIYYRTFECKNLRKCKRLLESLERSENEV